MPLSILCVDDEPLALRRLQLLLHKLPGVGSVDTAHGCAEAVARINDERPDIVILDIKMRDGLGFDVLENIQPRAKPAAIFVTAFDEFATRAFDVAAVDYVMKPVEESRLMQAIMRARAQIDARAAESRVTELKGLLNTLGEESSREAAFETELWIRGSTRGFVRVPVTMIDYAVAEDDYLRLQVGERSHLMRETVTGLQRRLDPARFFRVHRSALVQVDRIKEFKRNARGLLEVHLSTGTSLRVGRVYAKQIKDLLPIS